MENDLQALARAVAQYKSLELLTRFAGDTPGSAPTQTQREVIDDFFQRKYRHFYASGGNQCLVGETLVATPDGPRRIDQLRVGDLVLDPESKAISVVAVHRNGLQTVYNYLNGSSAWVTCTSSHKFLCEGREKLVKEIHDGASVCHAAGAAIPLRIDQKSKRTEEVFNITVDHPENLYQLANGLISKNSGKTLLAARLVSWILIEDPRCPYRYRLPRWGKQPLVILWAGRTTKQIEEVLLAKLQTFLEPGSFKVQRQGGVIQKLTYKNGNKIIFISHHQVKQAQEKGQAFAVNAVFGDELPGDGAFIEEMHRRCQASDGLFFWSFTPKVPVPSVKRIIDTAQAPTAKVYYLSALDNPVYTEEQKAVLLDSIKHYPKEYQETVLRGQWRTADNAVYFFDSSLMCRNPSDYSRSWRHVVSVDPANSSKVGLIIFAEDPFTSIWYVITARYLSGQDILIPSVLVRRVKEHATGLNVVRWVYDPAAAWFRGEASLQNLSFLGPYNKANRRDELQKALQKMLGVRLFISPSCTDLEEEMSSYRTNDEGTKIVNQHAFHLHDALTYGVDLLPEPRARPQVATLEDHDARLLSEHRARMKREAQATNTQVSMTHGRRPTYIPGQRR